MLARPGDHLLEAGFHAAMARLGPFPPRPVIAVAVSGGADSMALALLAQGWAMRVGGRIQALIVDHGLRQGSDEEARITRERLASRGIPAVSIRLGGIGGGHLQRKARDARHSALAAAARQAGALFLLMGHHAADQAETVAMRAKRGEHGLEGMAGWTARNDVVLLRPLLGMAPAALRDFLRARNMNWIEDPSNRDPRFERVRVRLAGAAASPRHPAERRRTEEDAADFIARHVILRPAGYAIVLADAVPAHALSALLRVLGGAQYPPRRAAVAALAEALRPATLGGVRILKAGRWGPGWLLVREAAACAPAVTAIPGTVWDCRFRLAACETDGDCGAAGADASGLRRLGNLPAAALAGLACIRGTQGAGCRLAKASFTPPAPACALPFSGP